MSQKTPPDFNFNATGAKDNSASKQPEPQSGAKKLLSSVSATAGAAAKLVVLQTERTRLTTITLPAAYRALGKDCVQQKRHLESVPELMQQLRSVIGDLKMLSEAVQGQPAAQSFTDKAKAAGKQAADLARQKQLGMKRDGLIAEIGKSILDLHGEESGPSELVAAIRNAITRLADVDAEIPRLLEFGKGSLITPKRVLIGATVMFVLTVAYFVFPTTSRDSDSLVKENSATFDENDPNLMEWNQRLTALRKIRAGMTIEQVENILGMADESDDDNDPSGVLAQRGETLTILTWRGDDPSDDGDFIKIGFINGRIKNLKLIEVNAAKE